MNHSEISHMSRTFLLYSSAVLLIVIASILRIIPHEWNFSPISAIFLFSIASFQNRWFALLLPLSTLWISDLYLMNTVYAKPGATWVWGYGQMEWMYATYLLIAFVGYFILRKINVTRVAIASVSASVLFFVITNFMCWPGSTLYTQDFNGLVACYTAGIPFFRGTFLGDLIFSTILFGSQYLVSKGLFLKLKEVNN
jgi:hypothetical protein